MQYRSVHRPALAALALAAQSTPVPPQATQLPPPMPPVPAPVTPAVEADTRPYVALVTDLGTITVRIDSHSTYRVICAAFDEEAPSEQELFLKLQSARDQTPSANKLMVIAHGDARHDKVVTAMDAGTAVGMDGIKLTTVEEDEY